MAEDKRYMTINMGPQHPATHGVLRVLLELDGEIIVKATPFIGYLHRGVEKLAEARTYHQALTLTDRLDYTNGLANNLAYCLAAEKLCGIEVPKRGQYLRVILAELQRIAAHLIWIGTHALDVGAMTLLFYAFRERETILEIVEHVTGARLTPSFIRVGGRAREMPPEFEENFELLPEIEEEWAEDDEDSENESPEAKKPVVFTPEQREERRKEIARLKEFYALASSIQKNSKGEQLLTALQRGFAKAGEVQTGHSGAIQQKALIFTESRRTQDYLFGLLQDTEFAGKVVLFNGSYACRVRFSSPASKQTFHMLVVK